MEKPLKSSDEISLARGFLIVGDLKINIRKCIAYERDFSSKDYNSVQIFFGEKSIVIYSYLEDVAQKLDRIIFLLDDYFLREIRMSIMP